LLGVEFVSGTGDIVRGGGRVTKNVAGFDLSRLVCGAWGTLGVLTEITMRLRALPERDHTLSIPLDGGTEGMIRTMQALHESGVAPAAMELLDATLCAKLGIAQSPSAEGAVLLRFCGNDAGVAVQTGRIQGAFPAIAHGSDIWRAYTSADIDGDGVAVVRLSARPSALPSLWDFATGLRGRVAGTVMTASAGRGIVRCAFPAQSLSGIADELSRRPPSSMIFEKLPADLWPLLAPPDQIADRLHQRVRDAFDPHRILNRGILGEAPQ
jgi:glycolate oxidase FAD binding subunit